MTRWHLSGGNGKSFPPPQCDLPGGDNRVAYDAERHADGVHARLTLERYTMHANVANGLQQLYAMKRGSPQYAAVVAYAKHFGFCINEPDPSETWANAVSAIQDTDMLLARLVEEEWNARRLG
jgi:hypothetical protein